MLSNNCLMLIPYFLCGLLVIISFYSFSESQWCLGEWKPHSCRGGPSAEARRLHTTRGSSLRSWSRVWLRPRQTAPHRHYGMPGEGKEGGGQNGPSFQETQKEVGRSWALHFKAKALSLLLRRQVPRNPLPSAPSERAAKAQSRPASGDQNQWSAHWSGPALGELSVWPGTLADVSFVLSWSVLDPAFSVEAISSYFIVVPA